MKINVSEATRLQLDWLVAYAQGSYDGTWLKLYGHKRKVIIIKEDKC